MIEEVAAFSWTRLIPALPLGAFVLHGLMIGLFRRSLSPAIAGAITIGAVGLALLVTVSAFAELISDPGNAAVLDHVGSWIGVGVGSAALVSDVAFRLDPLSVVMCLLITGVGLLALFYGIGEMRGDRRDDRGEQRFFAYASLLIGSMLVLVLADDLLLLAAAWCGVGLATWAMVAFWYSDAEFVRAATLTFVVGRLGDVALFAATAVVFWTLADGQVDAVGFAELRAAAPVLSDAYLRIPDALGGGLFPVSEFVAALLLFAILTKAAQLPFSGWLSEAVSVPTAGLVLIHTVVTVAAPIYLGVRMSFIFAEAPIASSLAAGLGAATALLAACVACAQQDVFRLLAWSTASQMGFALVAIGAAAPTAAVFQLIAHSFHKGVLIMAMGVAIASIGFERNLWKMGNIGSRLWVTRIDTWVAVLSIAGILPISVGFFSIEQVVVAIGTAESVTGQLVLTWMVLLAMTATGFSVIRMIYLAYYGETRIPSNVRWDEIEDPGPIMLWPMGILAALVVGGAMVGTPQIWADLLVDGVEDANSLHRFLAPVVDTAARPEIDPSLEWTLSGRAALMALLGALPAVWLYLYRPRVLDVLVARLSWPYRALERGFDLGPALRRYGAAPVLFLAERVLAGRVEAGAVESLTARAPARLTLGLADRMLKFAQSGSASVYLATSLIASLALAAYWLFFGGSGTT